MPPPNLPSTRIPQVQVRRDGQAGAQAEPRGERAGVPGVPPPPAQRQRTQPASLDWRAQRQIPVGGLRQPGRGRGRRPAADGDARGRGILRGEIPGSRQDPARRPASLGDPDRTRQPSHASDPSSRPEVSRGVYIHARRQETRARVRPDAHQAARAQGGGSALRAGEGTRAERHARRRERRDAAAIARDSKTVHRHRRRLCAPVARAGPREGTRAGRGRAARRGARGPQRQATPNVTGTRGGVGGARKGQRGEFIVLYSRTGK